MRRARTASWNSAEPAPERLRQEIAEECGWEVTLGRILDALQDHIHKGVDALIVTNGAEVTTSDRPWSATTTSATRRAAASAVHEQSMDGPPRVSTPGDREPNAAMPRDQGQC